MTYELAKQLKDAGFPQERRGGGHTFEPRRMPIETPKERHSDFSGAYSPTLEELIFACPEIELSNEGYTGEKGWRASAGWDGVGGYGDPCVYAPTPTEAVAMFWLALHTEKPPSTGGSSEK